MTLWFSRNNEKVIFCPMVLSVFDLVDPLELDKKWWEEHSRRDIFKRLIDEVDSSSSS